MVLHGASKNTADNADTLNEVQVCGAENLIRFKTGYFQVMGKRDRVEARREEENKMGTMYHAGTGNGKERTQRREPT
jgi:hypothetical protein